MYSQLVSKLSDQKRVNFRNSLPLVKMTLEEGCLSLKLECALRDLGFVEVQWRVIAHAGLFFVSPVGFYNFSLNDDLLGFQLSKHCPVAMEIRADCKILPTAKRALDLAFELSP